jgi:hypothetical protein
MWRWVTRGLVLSIVTLLLTPALLAQQQFDFVGELTFPDPGATQSGIVLVKGWALDPAQITKAELYVDDQFQFNLNQSEPRIDVVEAYPNYPGIHNIAPGFTTGFLASRFSNGPHTVYVKFYDSQNRIFELGRRTINIDNTLNQAPFGNVDIPTIGATYNASGSFPVVGWVADTDGVARVDVAIDNGNLQEVLYGDSRPDVGNTFPDFPGALFSGFIANIDTTRIQDGVHTLTVRATDRLGMSRLIGRLTVQVLNSNANLKPFGSLDEPRRDAVLYGTLCSTIPPVIISPQVPVNAQSHITPVRGWALDLGTRTDVGRVSYVELMVDGVRWYSTDDCGYSAIFNSYTNCYGLPRYDVERYYPNYPDSPRSGFMFTMDVGALLALGVRPGNHNLKVRVGDNQQTFAELPTRDGIPVFFTCAEQNHDFASLGSIDVPTNYDYMTGNVTFQGWALDENAGVTAVEIIIDGNFMGSAQYGFPRPDVAQAYPHVLNSTVSGWRFGFDTRKLSNARHRLTVRVLDGFGNRSEIGSVDFYTQNSNPAP